LGYVEAVRLMGVEAWYHIQLVDAAEGVAGAEEEQDTSLGQGSGIWEVEAA
jgi:hypothetical protein